MAQSNAYINSQFVNQRLSFGQDFETTTGLIFGYMAGSVFNADTGDVIQIPKGTISLTANATNTIYCNISNILSPVLVLNPVLPLVPNKYIPLWYVTTDTTSILSVIDLRTSVQAPDLPDAMVSSISVDTEYFIPADFATLPDFLTYMRKYSIAPGITVKVYVETHTCTTQVVWEHPQSAQIIFIANNLPTEITITPVTHVPYLSYFLVPPNNTFNSVNDFTITTTEASNSQYLFEANRATINTNTRIIFPTTPLIEGTITLKGFGNHFASRIDFCDVMGIFAAGNVVNDILYFNYSTLNVSFEGQFENTVGYCTGVINYDNVTSTKNVAINNSSLKIVTNAVNCTSSNTFSVYSSDIFVTIPTTITSSGASAFFYVKDSKFNLQYEEHDGDIIFGATNSVITASNSTISVYPYDSGVGVGLAAFSGGSLSNNFVRGYQNTTITRLDLSSYSNANTITPTNLIGFSSADGIDLTQISPLTFSATVAEVASVDLLTTPSTSDYNVYISNGTGSPHGRDTDGNAILAYKTDSDFWTFSTHSHDIYTGTVSSATTTQLTDALLNETLVPDFALGMYIIVFTNNGYEGVSRMVSAVATDVIQWVTPTTGTVPINTTFKVYIANVNVGSGGGNVFVSRTSTLNQTVFNTFPVPADQALVFFGSAFQPPSSYDVTNAFEITLNPDPSLPVGITVNFISRSLNYSSVVGGGNANQMLVKNSSTDGDYSWKKAPSGGTTGQYLKKQTNSDYDYVWATIASGSVPVGGTTGQVLKKNSGTNYDVGWGAGMPTPVNPADNGKTLVASGGAATWQILGPAGGGVPSGGTTGQVLAKVNNTSYNYTWINGVPVPLSPSQDGYVLRASTGGASTWVTDRYYLLVPTGTTAGLAVPGGSTAQRVDNGSYYGFRYNTNHEALEGYSPTGNVTDNATQYDLFQRSQNHPKISTFNDEFMGVQSGWTLHSSGGHTTSTPTAQSNHPGIYRITTNSTATDWVSLSRSDAASGGKVIVKKQVRYARWILRLPSITDIIVTLGLGDEMSNKFLGTDQGVGLIFDPAVTGPKFNYFERDGAAGFYPAVATPIGSNVVANNWYVIEMRIDNFVSGGNTKAVYFRMNGGAWVSVSLLAAEENELVTPAIRVETTTAATKDLDIDYFCIHTDEMGQRYT